MRALEIGGILDGTTPLSRGLDGLVAQSQQTNQDVAELSHENWLLLLALLFRRFVIKSHIELEEAVTQRLHALDQLSKCHFQRHEIISGRVPCKNAR